MVSVNDSGDENGGRFVVPSLVIRSRRRYRQPEKEVNVVCIGKQNHNILYVKLKLQLRKGTWATKMMRVRNVVIRTA